MSSTMISETISHNVSRYKTPGTKNSQTHRRHELLEAIKQRRHESMDEKRHITEVFENIDQIDEEITQNEEPMDTLLTSPNKRKQKKLYANKLMLSEWLLEEPIDFEEKWLMKICVKGVRNLVVANKGKTKCYTKSGHFICQFQSQLPGGSTTTPMRFTILDCVYKQEENTFYVLDVLVWNSFSVINSQTEFRFFFIQSKLQESNELQYISKGNQHKFEYAAHKPADLCTIAESLTHYTPNIDGVLFYHREVIYLSQVTPLVGWLKVYMVPEVLAITIHRDFLLEKPDNYKNFLDYVQNFGKIEKKRKNQRRNLKRDVEMLEIDSEVSEPVNDEAVMDI